MDTGYVRESLNQTELWHAILVEQKEFPTLLQVDNNNKTL